MLLLSLTSGLDLDIDFGDGDGGGGILKPTLLFFSIGAYIVRGFLMTDSNPIVAMAAGVIAGTIAVILMSIVLKWILSQQKNVNWSAADAVYQKGTVYLKIPAKGSGIVHVDINGVRREFKARTNDGIDIPTGSGIQVEKLEDGILIATAKM